MIYKTLTRPWNVLDLQVVGFPVGNMHPVFFIDHTKLTI